MLREQSGAVLFQQLLAEHYQTRVFFSADTDVPPFDKTIFAQLKELAADQGQGNSAAVRDHHITQKFQQFMNDRNPQQPFFAFMFYDTTHSYCASPDIKRIYPVEYGSCERLLLLRQAKTEAPNHYYNAVRFVDNEVQLLLSTLKDKGLLDNTIVIITGDHGEEFNDNQQDYWGHGSNFTRYQIQTPLVIYWPNSTPKIVTQQTNHYDIAPYLMKEVLGCTNPVSDYSIGGDLLADSKRPYLLVGSYINMGIVGRDTISTLLTTGDIVISDKEARVLAEVKPDIGNIRRALLEMREYYK